MNNKPFEVAVDLRLPLSVPLTEVPQRVEQWVKSHFSEAHNIVHGAIQVTLPPLPHRDSSTARVLYSTVAYFDVT